MFLKVSNFLAGFWGEIFPELTAIEELLLAVGTLVAIILVAFVLDKVIRRSIGKYGKKVDMEPHAINILKLVVRLLVATGAVISIFIVFEFSG